MKRQQGMHSQRLTVRLLVLVPVSLKELLLLHPQVVEMSLADNKFSIQDVSVAIQTTIKRLLLPRNQALRKLQQYLAQTPRCLRAISSAHKSKRI
jgi:hypothetical protein